MSDPKYECVNYMAGSQVNKVVRSHTHLFYRVNLDLEIHYETAILQQIAFHLSKPKPNSTEVPGDRLPTWRRN